MPVNQPKICRPQSPSAVWTKSIHPATLISEPKLRHSERTPNPEQLKETKVQLRMRPMQKAVIARAAELKHTTLTNFMIQHAMEAAESVLSDQLHFQLSPQKWDEFCAALDAPIRDLPRLRKLLTEPSLLDEAK